MAMPQRAYLDSELELSSLEAARFTWAGGDYRGKPSLGPYLAERLLALETEPEEYGLALYEAVFPRDSELREGLREAILAAEQKKSRLRFRLHLSLDLPDWVHALYWELLADPDRHLALARSPDTAFSRYLDARRAQGALAPGRPRLLCVVSAPTDGASYGMAEIRRDEILRSLKASFSALAGAVEVAFLDLPATLGRLRGQLMEKGGFQLLHFFGHGLSRGGVSALVLENEWGLAQPVDEKLLAEVFLGRELRLVTLVACHGGAPSSRDPFGGLAGRLVQRGVPSVIATRRAVSADSAHLFTQNLYRYIAQTGRADGAINEARQQLYLAEPKGLDWSSPVLYSRLSDGRLWLPRQEILESAQQMAESGSPLLLRSLHRFHDLLPWLSLLSDSKRVARLQARRNSEARSSLVREFGALTSTQVEELAGSHASDRALANIWKQEGRIFSVSYERASLYPAFQFDAEGRPRPVIAEVIRTLGAKSTDWELALWFTTNIGWLDGQRPVDLLESDPAAVAEAAESEAVELVY